LNKHYIRLDLNNNIIYGFSDAFEQPQEGDICINENGGRHFELLGNVNPSLITQDGFYFYQYVNDNVIHNANPVISIDKVKENKINELNFLCNQTILGGFSSNCLDNVEHRYKFDEEYQRNFGLAIGAISISPDIENIPWPTVDSGIQDHTKSQFIQLYLDGKAFMESNLYRYFGMKAQVLECTEISQIEAFVW